MRWASAPAPNGPRLFFDVASNNSIEQPVGLDEKGTGSLAVERQKRRPVVRTRKTRRLTAVRGARLTTLSEKDWYAVDRIPLAALRKRLAESPLKSYTLADTPNGEKPDLAEAEKVLRKLPTFVLESAKGKIVLLRVEQYDGDSALVLCRARPLVPYPPFHAGRTMPRRPGRIRPPTRLMPHRKKRVPESGPPLTRKETERRALLDDEQPPNTGY